MSPIDLAQPSATEDPNVSASGRMAQYTPTAHRKLQRIALHAHMLGSRAGQDKLAAIFRGHRARRESEAARKEIISAAHKVHANVRSVRGQLSTQLESHGDSELLPRHERMRRYGEMLQNPEMFHDALATTHRDQKRIGRVMGVLQTVPAVITAALAHKDEKRFAESLRRPVSYRPLARTLAGGLAVAGGTQLLIRRATKDVRKAANDPIYAEQLREQLLRAHNRKASARQEKTSSLLVPWMLGDIYLRARALKALERETAERRDPRRKAQRQEKTSSLVSPLLALVGPKVGGGLAGMLGSSLKYAPLIGAGIGGAVGAYRGGLQGAVSGMTTGAMLGSGLAKKSPAPAPAFDTGAVAAATEDSLRHTEQG